MHSNKKLLTANSEALSECLSSPLLTVDWHMHDSTEVIKQHEQGVVFVLHAKCWFQFYYS